MKFYNGCFVTLFIILVFAPAAAIYAQENDFDTYEDIEIEDDEPDFDIYDYAEIEDDESDFYIYDYVETKDNETSNRPFIVYNEGAASSWLTRIVKQTKRSNFVFDDFLVGLYLNVDLENIKYITPTVRLAVYYPMISTFNKVPQYPKDPLHYGVDLNAGLKLDILEFEYFRLDMGLALHLFFLNAERWNYLNLGASVFLGMEVPLTKGWTFLCGGSASLDNGNLGGNHRMEPFDIAYQYQVEAGVRYSKKLANKTFLFVKKPQTMEEEPEIFAR